MTGITHKQAGRYLRAAADGLLRDYQRILLDAHLGECISCRAEADELNALEARLKKNFQARWDAHDGPSKNVMANIQSRSRRIIMTNRINMGLRMLASVAALIILGFAINYVILQLRNTSVTANGAQDVGSESHTNNRLIAFTSKKDGNLDIYTIYTDGSGLTNLTNHPAKDDNLAWSPDGSKIAFVSDRDGNDDIYLMNADGGGLTRLTTSPASDTNPVWSPDGKKIAYSSGDFNRNNTNIYVMDADGKNQHQVTEYTPNTLVWPDSWSRDSQSIYFEVYRQVVQVGVNGGDVKAITPPTDKDAPIKFVWSKDGSTLMYLVLCSEDNFCFTLKSINRDGTGEKNLATLKTPGPCEIGHASTWFGSWIKWSPDRTKILFAFTCEDSGWIYIANADGTNFEPLLNFPILGNGPDNEVAMGDWSPDSQSIVFTSALDQTNKFGIYTLNVNDALENPSIRPTRLVDSLNLASSPAWQPQPNNKVVENVPTPAPLTVQEAEALAGFDVLEPSYLPEGFAFEGASYAPQFQWVALKYVSLASDSSESSVMYIYQKHGDLSQDQNFPSHVTPAPIGDVMGEYVRGAWVYEPTGTTAPKWDSTADHYSLNWKKDGASFVIDFLGGETIPPIPLADLIAIAESMKHVSHPTSDMSTPAIASQETSQPFRFGVPVESKQHALIAAQSGLRRAYRYVEPLIVITVEQLSYGEYAKRINQPLNSPADLQVWFIVYFNNEWQSTLPDPTEYINNQGQIVPLPTEMVPASQFRGCVYMAINADDGSTLEVGGPLQMGLMAECDK